MTDFRSKEEVISFYNGLREGISLYAHWKDGVQYVGTTGKTLKKAIEEITAKEQQKLEDVSYNNDR